MSWLFSWAAGPLSVFATIAITVLFVAVPLTVWRAREVSLPRALRRTGKDVALAISLALIAALTIAPIREARPSPPVNLLPFRDIWLATQGQIAMSQALVELGANVILFVPFGMSLAWRRPETRLGGIFLAAVVLSGCVEAFQAVSQLGRQADVTDLLANVAGAVTGALLVRRIAGRA